MNRTTATLARSPHAVGWSWGTAANQFRAPLLTCALVACLALLPVLHDPWFYYRDDAAEQILPMWYSLGERIRDGVWPPLLDTNFWMGGNLAAETLFGVWNPMNIFLWVGVSLLPNMAVSATLVRIVAFVLIALGCYLVCREYGAARFASSAVAVAFPFCGSLFYFDAARWLSPLVAFVWVPYLWWAARRMVRGSMNVFWVFGLGVLAVTAGNPYTTLAVCVVLLGLHVETVVRKQWHALRRLVVTSLTIASIAPLVYLPLVLSAGVTWRISGKEDGLQQGWDLAPHVQDLMNLSLPGYLPAIPTVTTSAVYFCWFALPLALWLDWAALRHRWRELTSIAVVAALYLAAALGPGEIWLFRWPLRVLHYGYLGLAILLAVLLSSGLRTDHWRQRAIGTGAVALLAAGLAFWVRHNPHIAIWRYAVSMGFLAIFTALAIWTHRRRGARSLGAVLHLGTMTAFALQVIWFTGGHRAEPYYVPSSVADVQANFKDRYRGETIQIANTNMVGPPDQPREAWRDLMRGNLYHPAGIDTIDSYTGIGFRAFASTLCMNYLSSTCSDAYQKLWRQPMTGSTATLADLLQLDTVVVQRRLINEPTIPPGWRVTDRDDRVTILQRQPPVGRPAGRLSWASPDVHATTSAAADDRHEKVQFDRTGRPGPGKLIFALLAWPGYHATIDGVDLPVRNGPAGLLEIDLPPAANRGQLVITWTPPGLPQGVASAAAGLLAAAALGTIQSRRQVTTRTGPQPDSTILPAEAASG